MKLCQNIKIKKIARLFIVLTLKTQKSYKNMKIKIAIPTEDIFAPILINSINVENTEFIELIRLPQARCAELFHKGMVDVALISPLDYGKGINYGDYRIIKEPLLALSGYTQAATTYFKPRLKNINSIASNSPDDFMIIIGKILLSERYDVQSEIQKAKGNVSQILENFDTVIEWGCDETQIGALDITEDWQLSYEAPLILGMWVAKSEEIPEELPDLLRSFAGIRVDAPIERGDNDSIANEGRQGLLITAWDETIEESLENTLNLLYFHKYLSDIPAVKIFGLENKELKDIRERIDILEQKYYEAKENGEEFGFDYQVEDDE